MKFKLALFIAAIDFHFDLERFLCARFHFHNGFKVTVKFNFWRFRSTVINIGQIAAVIAHVASAQISSLERFA